MNVTETQLPGVLIFEPRVFKDDRGYFFESFHGARFSEMGIEVRFVQDNVSFSSRRVLRGLHYQLGSPQCKLVMALSGEIFDVAVDIRRGSPTFGRWTGSVLSSENHLQMLVPIGFAHGFCVLSETATVLYKCTDYYVPKEERGIRWDDPRLAIEWPCSEPIVSEKDRLNPTLESVAAKDLPGLGSPDL
jgi:dTDP-4-dehydrorhamnose 3,5-epimerase